MEITEEKLFRIISVLKENDIYASVCYKPECDENEVYLDRVYVDGDISFELIRYIYNSIIMEDNH